MNLCTVGELYVFDEHTYLLYCGKWRKISRRDLDLDRTMPSVKLLKAISVYYNLFKNQID